MRISDWSSDVCSSDLVGVDKPIGDLPGLALGFFLFEGVDQLDRREDADPLSMMLDGLNAQCRGDMGLAGARTADQHDIVGDVDKVAAVKLPDQRLIDIADGTENGRASGRERVCQKG